MDQSNKRRKLFRTQSHYDHEELTFLPANKINDDIYNYPETAINVEHIIKDNNVLVKITPDENNYMICRDYVILLDVSGSMTQHFNSMLESCMNIIDLLKENDRISIIVFSSFAKQLFGLSKVTNKQELKDKLIQNNVFGQETNYQAGAELALKTIITGQVQDGKELCRETLFLFLTDGQPTDGILSYNVFREIITLDRVTSYFCTFGGGVDANYILTILEKGNERIYRHCNDFTDLIKFISNYSIETGGLCGSSVKIILNATEGNTSFPRNGYIYHNDNLYGGLTKYKYYKFAENLSVDKVSIQYKDINFKDKVIDSKLSTELEDKLVLAINNDKISKDAEDLMKLLKYKSSKYISFHKHEYEFYKSKLDSMSKDIETTNLEIDDKSQLSALLELIKEQLDMINQDDFNSYRSVSLSNSYVSMSSQRL